MRLPPFLFQMSIWASVFASLRDSSAKLSFTIAPYCLSKEATCSNPPAFDPARISKETCGEDDFILFLQEESFSTTGKGISLFGVADGVGGWNQQGIDPKLLTSALIDNIRTEFTTFSEEPLKRLVEKAYENMRLQRKEIRFGSCTLALLTFDHATNHLNSFNLGDSGFMIVRDGKVFWKSAEQQRYFNAPYQIGLIDGHPADLPEVGKSDSFVVQSGDVVIVRTDGLFDNLFDKDILQVVAQRYKQRIDKSFPSEVARELALRAKCVGESKTGVSPFGKNAEEVGYYFKGGKDDDTTVLVTIFTRSEKSEL